MAKQIKLSKAELEKDQALEFSETAYFWLRHHSSKIFAVLAIIFVVYAAVLVMRNRSNAVSVEASNKLYGAVQSYEKGLSAAWGSPERKDAMIEARKRADAVIQEYGDHSIARNALYLKGNAYYFQGDDLGSTVNTQEAIKIFSDYRDQAAKVGDDFEKAAALIALGYANENLWVLSTSPTEGANALVAAITYYDQTIALGDKAGFLRYEAMNDKARILEVQGKPEDAAKLYREVVKARMDPAEADVPNSSDRNGLIALAKHYAGLYTTGQTAYIRLQHLGLPEDKEKTEPKT
ncbi:hypothetical protein BH09SUM1_BH09SUM1_23260 [soil metagenome]